MIRTLLNPGILLVKRVSYGQKFFRLSAILVLSSLMMAGIVANGSWNQLMFTWKEQQGMAVIARAERLLSMFQKQVDIGQLRQGFGELAKVSEQYKDSLSLDEKWGKFKTRFNSSAKDLEAKNDEVYAGFTADLFDLVSYVGDKSNLILDPDLDTYYLMDSVVLRILQASDDLQALNTMLAELLANPNEPKNDRHARLMALEDRLTLFLDKVGIIRGNLVVVRRETSKPSILAELGPETLKFVEQANAYGALVKDLTVFDQEPTLERVNAIVSHANGLIDELHTLHNLTGEKLYERLGDRAQGIPIPGLIVLALLVFSTGTAAYVQLSVYTVLMDAVTKIKDGMKRISEGDLTVEVRPDCDDELADVSTSLNKMVGDIRHLVKRIQSDVVSLTQRSDELQDAANEISSIAEDTTKVADTAVSCLDEVADEGAIIEQGNQQVMQAIGVVNDNMQTVSAAAEEMSSAVTSVAAAVEEMTAALNEISRSACNASLVAKNAYSTTEEARQIISVLEKAAEEVGSVVSVIRNIASQTSLLALNATIEAASAGDAGKGFAVVANEVKNLAKQAAEGTEEIRAKVEHIQNNTRRSVEVINRFGHIVEEMNDITATIAAAVEEQTATLNEVCQNIAGASVATNEVASNITLTAHTADEVSSQARDAAEKLSKMTTALRLLVRHNPRLRLQMMLEDEESITLEDVQRSSRSTQQNANTVRASADTLADLSTQLQQIVGSFKT
jgi:methyl-accepting chemotaxis protein